jgi:hypothetical protein
MARLELVLGAGEAAKPGMQLTHSGDDWTRCTRRIIARLGAYVGGGRSCKARDAINTFRGMNFTSTYAADHGSAGACVGGRRSCKPGMQSTHSGDDWTRCTRRIIARGRTILVAAKRCK